METKGDSLEEKNTSYRVDLLYGLDDKVSPGRTLVYSVQHLIYFMAGCAILPVIIGGYLGLSQGEIAELLQRLFLLCGIFSLIQVLIGHRFTIIEGPVGIWMGIIIILSGSAQTFGKSLGVLRTDMELGMIVAGICTIVIGIFGLVPLIAKVFTHLANGTFLLLMCIQLSASVMKGAFGISDSNQVLHVKSLIVFLFTTLVILAINIRAKGFVQSIAILIGTGCGWMLAFVLGVADKIQFGDTGIISLPQAFAWGQPTFDPSVVITCVLGSVLVFANFITAIQGMSELCGEKVEPKQLNRAAVVTGISTSLTGVIPSLGLNPFPSSTGAVAMTRVAARKPFALGSIYMILLGLVTPVCMFFSAIPAPVGYAAMMITFSLIVKQSFSVIQKQPLTNREGFIIGITLMVGAGMMFLPAETFCAVPQMIRYIISNGLIVGIIVEIVLEQIVFRKK